MKKFFALAAVAALALTASAQDLYMTGDSSVGPEEGGLPANWAPENPAVFEVVDGNYQVTVNGLKQFKISTVMGGWDEFNKGVLGCNYGKEPGVWVAFEAGNQNNIFCPWEGEWTVTVKADLSEICLTTTTPRPDDMSTKLYFRGDMNGWGADAEWQLKLVEGSETLYKFVCAEGQSVPYGTSFKIADADWGECNFGYYHENGEILFDVDTELEGGANPDAFSLEGDWDGVCWFDLETKFVAFSNDKEFVPEFVANAAVNEVAVATEAPVYFNLQGVKVANPANGIYVVVKGGKAYKTVVK